MGKPRNTQKYLTYPKYLELPKSKKDTRKYPIVYFDTPTRLIPGILSTTRSDLISKNPTCWALAGAPFYISWIKARRKKGVNESNTFELFQYKRRIKKCPTCNKIQIMKNVNTSIVDTYSATAPAKANILIKSQWTQIHVWAEPSNGNHAKCYSKC